MGASYRIGHEDTNVGDLITSGIFSKGRNPIYFGMDGLVVCAFLEQSNIFFPDFCRFNSCNVSFHDTKGRKRAS